MEGSQEELESFYGALRNLDKLELRSFRNVIKAVFSPTLRERYLTVNYHRAAFNVEMLLATKDTKQFQAVALLARAVFELSVEIKLIHLDKDAAKKIALFSQVELLRSARRLVAFRAAHPDVKFHYETHSDFIDAHGKRIDAEQAAMWPPNMMKRGKTTVKHWTKKDLLQRATSLGDPFDRIYHVHYAELSWLSHSGVVSPLNMTTAWVTSFVGIAYSIAVDSYMEILEILVNEFKLYNTDPMLKKKILCSKALGFTSTPEQAAAVMQHYGVQCF
jgi:hypothetical protein